MKVVQMWAVYWSGNDSYPLVLCATEGFALAVAENKGRGIVYGSMTVKCIEIRELKPRRTQRRVKRGK